MRSSPRALHALLIGIDHYGSAQGADPALVYPTLAGCVRDVARLRKFLADQQILPVAHIESLISPFPAVPENAPSLATYDRIIRAFETVTDQAEPGDTVWIHFSGHGGRTPTSYPGLKGPRAHDEALVPSDIGSSESRYLRDVELAFLLDRLVRRGLFVTLVLDCCHAGGLLREGMPDLPGARARWNEISSWVRSKPSAVASEKELMANWRRQALSPSWQDRRLVSPSGYTALFACRPFERAHEYEVEPGQQGGALTHFLLESLDEAGPEATYSQVFGRLRSALRVHLGRFQNPLLEGACDRVLLSGEGGAASRGATVLLCDGDQVVIAAGAAHGVERGARFEIESLLTPEGEERTVVEAEDVSGVECLARVPKASSGAPPAPQPGDRAILLSLAPRRWSVALHLEGLPPNERSFWQPLASQLQDPDSPWLSRSDGTKADLHLWPQPERWVDVQDSSGISVGCIPADIASHLIQADHTIQLLEHILHFRALETLRNEDPSCPIRNAISAELAILKSDFQPGEDPCEAAASLPSPAVVEAGAWVALILENRFDQPLEVVVLELTSAWSVAQIHPTGGDSQSLDPGERFAVPFRAALTPGSAVSRDRLRIFATYDPVRFRWLELPPLGLVKQRGALLGQPRHPLESQLATWQRPGPILPSRFRDRFASREWAVFDLLIEVQKPKRADSR